MKTRTTHQMLQDAQHDKVWAERNNVPPPTFFVTKDELDVLMADLGKYRNDPPLPNQICGLELKVFPE